ncbi:MAG: HD domain-containing protein [Candidatus Promineifilaceae bacterium]|nr:HD domain-containing protein [Candidatus Promineifilaceae bacterium]
MKSIFVNQLQPGNELINEPFLLDDVTRRKTRDGRPFLLCILRDRTGILNSVFWDVPDYVDHWVRPGIVVLVSGQANNYKNSLQVNITDLNKAGSIASAELLPSSQRPRDEMLEELKGFIAGLSEPWHSLAAKILFEEPLFSRFADAPAARSMHHAYIGGLMEHTLSMATLAELLALHYPHVNDDLLLTGTLLHDVGKTEEYSIESAFGFSEDGRLVGHIVRAVIMIEKAASEISFPEEELRQLLHLIISHHGTEEWGSPIKPKTLEAILLHQIDLLDSRVQGFFDHVQNDGGDEFWTTKSSYMHGSELRRPPGLIIKSQNDN